MMRWILTCEHGGHQVPARWRHLFAEADDVLRSHRGWDRGALCTFRMVAPEIADAAFFSNTTRLLVDLNRSVGHRALFSEFTRDLPEAERREILRRHYYPFRDRVAETIRSWRMGGETVVHISIHSFTPVLDGESRNADVGLLYDPGRGLEKSLCRRWKALLGQAAPGYRTRLNYPYRGTADGFTKWLRRAHPTGYAGIELELNEGNVGRRCGQVADRVLESLRMLKADNGAASRSAGSARAG
jgi:predicted N-formylglutamate amidohydrolase